MKYNGQIVIYMFVCVCVCVWLSYFRSNAEISKILVETHPKSQEITL